MKSKINRGKLAASLPKYLVSFLRLILIVGMSYVFLFPVLYLVSMSIRHSATISDPSIVWVPKELSMESITMAWEVMDYGKSALLSLVIAISSTLCACISCSLVGYGLSRFKFAERNFLFFIVILMIVVPPYCVLIPSYMNFRFFDINIFGWVGDFEFVKNLGLLKLLHSIIPAIPEYLNLAEYPSSILTFILPSLFASGLRSGLFIFIFRQNFLGMPKDLEEAACIDGCSPFRTYTKVIMPLATSAFITVMLFSFVWHWNDYSNSVIYFLGDMKPVSIQLSNLRNTFQMNFVGSSTNFVTANADALRTYLSAGALLVVIPPLVLYIFTQKFFTESIERTGIVG